MPQLQPIQTGAEWNVLGLQKLWGTDRVLLNKIMGTKAFSLSIFRLLEAYKRRISQRSALTAEGKFPPLASIPRV